MKALSIHQPYASLIACGAKEYETRGWDTSYRGELAICASKSHDGWRWIDDELLGKVCAKTLRSEIGEVYGAVVAVIDLVNVDRTTLVKASEFERQVGDWSTGRYCWRCGNVRKLTRPVPLRGAQGLYMLSPDVEAAVRVVLAEMAAAASEQTKAEHLRARGLQEHGDPNWYNLSLGHSR